MQVQLKEGILSLLTDDGVFINNITAYTERNGTHYDVIERHNAEWEIVLNGKDCASVRGGGFFLDFVSDGGVTLVKGRYSPEEKTDGLTKICYFKGKTDFCFEKAYVNGYTLFNGVRVHEMQAPVKVKKLMDGESAESSDFCAGIYSDGCLLSGAVTFCERISATEICSDGSISLCGLHECQPFGKGDAAVSDVFAIKKSRGLAECLKDYAALVNKYNVSDGIGANKAMSGWCSWYYYGPNISEEIILENLYEIKRREVPAKVIQIDDGWSLSRGDWEPNGKFPHGMKWLADKIKDAGYIPGIWVAPLTAEDNSEFLKNNRDLFVKGFDCDDLYGWNTLDFSNPKACGFLYGLFRKLSYEWGYRYIKFDFMAFGMSAGRHSDKNFNAVKNYRKALEIIKSAVTKDTFLLACTSPLLPAIGFVHSIRTSMDIFERWQSLKNVAGQILLRWYLNDRVITDPDCVMLRTAKNEDGECFRLCTRTEKEIETYITLIAVSGGNTMLSDKVKLLSDEQLKKFSYLYPVNGRAGDPADITESDIPSVIDCGVQGEIRTVALFNWTDYEKTLVFPLGQKYGLFDFWEREYLGERETLKFSIPAHGCKVLHCTLPGAYILGAFERVVPSFEVYGGVINNLKKHERLLVDRSAQTGDTDYEKSKDNTLSDKYTDKRKLKSIGRDDRRVKTLTASEDGVIKIQA